VPAFSLKPVVIEGEASFAKNNTLRFYFYNDLSLQKRVLCAQTKVDNEGNFRVQIATDETTVLILACNTIYGQMYIEPEKQYQVKLFADENMLKRIDAEMLGASVEIRITSSDTNELNYKINRFDRYYSYFFYLYSQYLFSHPPIHIYDSIVGLLTERFPIQEDATDYYSVYTRYKIAYIDLLYYHKDKSKLYDKYLNSPYIYYNNTAYMDFFNSFFENYLYAGTRKITHQVLYQNINGERNYYKLLDEMGKDPVLLNEKIREMVFIKGLGELYGFEDEFNHYNILFLLSQMNKESKFREHRLMANNLIDHLQTLKSGTKAPNFMLKDVYNSPVSLDDFKGRYLYLHFFTSYCEDCIREMLILKSLQEQYKDSLQIVSVMLDFEQAGLYHFVNTYKEFTWKFLHFGGNFLFIEDYAAYSLPLGVLIDSQGRVVNYPAKSPSEGLLLQIFTLFPTVGRSDEAVKKKY
jgi:thiol-disulfide isomerase/thioredoxin